MRTTSIQSSRRPGFTLIELLVVIAIIAILASLLMVSIFKALERGKDLQARSDITDLSQAVTRFKQHFGVEYLPSRIRIGRKPSGDAESDAFISRMFPNHAFLDRWQKTGIVWNNKDSSTRWLEGHQCLVFFLGGPQVNYVPQGWAKNPTNPADTTGQRVVFYDFDRSRLRRPSWGQGDSRWLAYYDAWEVQPYIYYSKKTNPGSYYRYDIWSPSYNIRTSPYGIPPNYINPDSFQIISAGADKRFGRYGYRWTPEQARVAYPPRSDGNDDMANFHTAKLGFPQ